MAKDLARTHDVDIDPAETAEWLESLEYVLKDKGPARVSYLLSILDENAQRLGIELPYTQTTPYINTIASDKQPAYPGNRELERRIKSIIRWNAMAMVVKANKKPGAVGGHISTYASSATLLEVGFNHFFRGKDHECGGDVVYFQGHACPGVYSRAFVEGRLNEQHLENFRRELQDTPGLSSYPHPWLMPNFWEYPTVSMGLGPIMSIYRARFMEYLYDRGLAEDKGAKVWAFLGDGECDEPETLGAITLASREKLDNLIWVINCNLQRLDGPVRGNGKMIQELEGIFRGAGWNVIKVVWGEDWDDILKQDKTGQLVKRMGEVVDGEYQKYTVSDGAYIREHFFNKYPDVAKLVEHLSDDDLTKLRRGGHDPDKVYTAYKAATQTKDMPTVILAKTVKGYGLGEAGEGKNITHSQKKLNEDELREFRSRFGIPISDKDVADAPFYVPAPDSPEGKYLQERRTAMGGPVPERRQRAKPLTMPTLDQYSDFLKGSGKREMSTTMGFVRLFTKLLRDKNIGKHIVPIVPDESRTFGMEALFRQVGIYAHAGQHYDPVDSDTMLYYKEAQDGQIFEEGITEAGAMSSFIAAGTSHTSHGVYMIPFFIYYSMFGFQRIGDLIWAAGDMRTRGFMLGGTAGRTTLNGEGLQHQDGHSILNAIAFPSVKAYDPAYVYETNVIIFDGLKRMYQDQEDWIYYITLENDNYVQPEMPEGVEEGIVKGIYPLKEVKTKKAQNHVQLFGSGAILNEVLDAQQILADKYNVSSQVWSVTSYNELRRDAQDCERWNMLHADQTPRQSYIQKVLEGKEGPVIAASDYVRAVAEQLTPWIKNGMYVLGTDGYGRSETREALRRFFEVD
ncbi:pyruvate dehydrogenase (acetyl-transferring), homodimeric type, partial [bacterium AH-315-I18]|nr:pyruvate dehydrogenase (acetyl-transferring), homodimeric type [bacterium AH-315-I18]